jgi:hypothetical protein
MRTLFLALAPIVALAGPAFAAPQYQAELASPVTTKMIVRDMNWACAGNSCSAARTGTSPDGVVCVALAKKLGPLTGFTAGDRVFDASQLDKCNGAARIAAK